MNNKNINPKILKNFIASHSKYEKIENFNKNVNLIIDRIKSTNRKIAIVSDFDYTLTRRFDLENEKINFYSSYCVFEHFKHTTDEYRIKNKDLFNTYYKYEMDETLEFNKRKELVFKWYKHNLDLIIAEKITKEHFKEMVDHSHEKFYFRNGILELFEIVLEYKIPFYIISGGLYDIIEHSLRFVIPFYDILEENKLLNIIANKFIYDANSNNMIGYQEPIVFTFNKGEMIKNHFDRNNDTTENIILLGDHVNDVDSITHLSHIKNSVKIGFLNSKKPINSPEDFLLYDAFSKRYDIGIMNDPTLNIVNHILYDIFSKTGNIIKYEDQSPNIKV